MPLADEMRPTELFGIIGQQHILGPGRPLTKIVDSNRIPNMIFYGPPGVGKTTVARIIADKTNKQLFKLNGTALAADDIKEVLSAAKKPTSTAGVLLYLDEIQYLNKRQQQKLLEAFENGLLTMIASTTENPYFCIYKAVLSRCTVFEFKSVKSEQLKALILTAFTRMSEITGVKYTVMPEVIDYISIGTGGDVRKCISAVEMAALSSDGVVSLDTVKLLTQSSSMSYDRDGDQHYDVLSALHKSIRGSDVDAALHYAAILISAGDILSLSRRLLAVASEDIGLAYPQAVSITKTCVDSALQLGFPEARLPLAEAVILLATAPKSNSVKLAIDAALADVSAGLVGEIPRHLQNTHCDGKGNGVYGQNYKYPHDYRGHYVKQQYMPLKLSGKTYYTYGDNKFEQAVLKYMAAMKGE